MSDLKIEAIKVDKKRLGEEEVNKILPKIPHFIITVGKVKSGKSVLYNNLYLKPEMYGDKFDIRILLSPTAHQDEVNCHLCDAFDFIIDDVNESVVEELLDMIKNDETDARYLMIFDDIVGAVTQKRAGKPDLLSQLATKYRHIGNKSGEGKLSIMLCSQYWAFLTPTLRNNASAYFIMGHMSGQELKSMSQGLSVFGGSDKAFTEIYKKSKQEPYDFLYLDMGRLKAWRNFTDLLWSEEDLFKENKDKKGQKDA